MHIATKPKYSPLPFPKRSATLSSLEKTRNLAMPSIDESSESLCPCCSGLPYSACCQPLHKGKSPETAEKLMRSRFSAYALNLPDYIIETTHPGNPHYAMDKFSWKRDLSRFVKATQFKQLEVLDAKTRGSVASVTFTAHIEQNGQDGTFTEKSYFEKIQGRWLYRNGLLVEGHAPNLVTTGQLRLLPLAYYGEPVLTKKADPITEITEDIVKLAEEMIETMNACQGMGLAAPQVHHSIRMFVIRQPIEKEDTSYELGEPHVLINPEIVETSEETWIAPEGCLSIPMIRLGIKRAHSLQVKYTDLEGKLHIRNVSGWEAKVIQHEYDHIEGILFIDRLPKEEQEKLAPFLENLKKRMHDGTEM